VIRDLGVWVCQTHYEGRLALRFFEWALDHPDAKAHEVKAVLSMTPEEQIILRAKLEADAGIPPSKRTVKQEVARP